METESSEIMSLFIRLNKLRATLMFMEMKAIGITGPQIFVLRELFMQQPRTLGDLSKALELSNSTVTGIVDRLERDGLVSRTRDENDRRVIWVSTTELCNLKKKERFQKIQADLRSELDASFTPEEFALLRTMLEKLIVNIENMLEGIT